MVLVLIREVSVCIFCRSNEKGSWCMLLEVTLHLQLLLQNSLTRKFKKLLHLPPSDKLLDVMGSFKLRCYITDLRVDFKVLHQHLGSVW